MSASTPRPDDDERFHYLPYLDGLRGVAILLVMGFHGMGRVSNRVADIVAGWSGVDIFFVISGFLITSILLQEQKDLGSFSLKRFYIRRTLRIWPAYYVFLFVMLLTGRPLSGIGVSAVYLTNYDVAFGWTHSEEVSHLWSLAVEEQFYLVWPITLLLAGRRALPLVLGLLGAMVGWRTFLLLYGAPWIRLSGGFDTRPDGLLMGCLAALLWATPRLRVRVRSALAGTWMPLVLSIALLFTAQTLNHPSDTSLTTRFLLWTLRLPVFNAMTALLILALLVQPVSLVKSSLAHPALVWIGRLSYSLYLWHAIAFNDLWRLTAGFLPRGLANNPLCGEVIRLLLCLAVASASFYLVEKPFLALKSRWESERRKPALRHETKPELSLIHSGLQVSP